MSLTSRSLSLCSVLIAVHLSLGASVQPAAAQTHDTGAPAPDGNPAALSESSPASEALAADEAAAESGSDSSNHTEKVEIDPATLASADSDCSPEDAQGRSICIGFGDGEIPAEDIERRLADEPDLVPWCPGNTTNEYDRDEACLAGFTPLTVIITVEEVPVGTATWAMRQEIKLHDNPAQVEQAIWLVPMAMDASLESVTLNWEVFDSCGSECTRSLQRWDGSLTWTPGDLHSASGSHLIDWIIPQTKSDTEFSLAWGMEAYSPAAPTSPDIVEWGLFPPLDVRCDNVVSGLNVRPGCVFPEYVPAMEYSMSGPYAELARHIAVGVEFGMPSRRDNPLTRITNSEDIRRNGNKACKDSYPRPEGKSCDEFPFRSTAQGAYTSDPDGLLGLKALELPGCDITIRDPAQPWGDDIGYTVCMIDERQNSNGGRALQTFYEENRVMDGDNFYVDITA